MKSNFNSYEYIVDIYVPQEAPPEHGFAVYIVLDGTRYGKMMQETLTNQLRNRMKTGVEAAIIIGIGHHEKDIPQQRFYDFTGPAAQYNFPVRRGREMKPMPAGGAEKLMQFLMEQVLPMVKEKHPVNPNEIALYGHSLGGLFVLWSYLNYPAKFSKYAAISPSIWWNEHELFTILDQAQDSYHSPLYITVGGAEGDMVDDAKKFAEIAAEKGIRNEFYVADQENHASVIPTTMSRILRFFKNANKVLEDSKIN